MEIISGLVAPTLQYPAASVTAPPDAAATQRFSALMQAPAAEPTGAIAGTPAVGGAAAALPALEPAAAKGPASFGDRVLGGMQNVSNEFRSHWTQVSDMLRAGSVELDMKDLLKLQMHMAQASVQYEMVGKGVSRATQNFDQLVRVQ